MLLKKSKKSGSSKRKNFVQIRNISSDSEAEIDQEEEPLDDHDDTEQISRQKRKEFLKRKIDEMITKDPKKAKLLPKSLDTPLTVEEINELKETENKFHSNLFRMQANELLAEIKLSAKTENRIQNWLDEFNRKLTEPVWQTSATDAWDCKVLRFFPFKVRPELLRTAHFAFAPPTEPSFFVNDRAIGLPTNTVDVCVQMPIKFRAGDNLNLRYHYKRFYYLLELGQGLKGFVDLVDHIEVGLLNNDPLKPVLVITPNAERFGKKLRFQIHAVCNEADFKLMRFLPEKNHVRLQCIDEAAEDGESVSFPTPHYNTSVLSDLTLLRNVNFLQRTLAGSPNIIEALILLNLWLKQRNFDQGYYGFDGNLMAMYVAYLVQAKRVFGSMSAYQIIRLVWNQLGQSRWDEKGITLNTATGSDDKNLKPIDYFHQYFDVVFLDVTGYVNICANLSVDLYRKVRSEAVCAIKCLDRAPTTCFQSLFMQKYSVYLQYDHHLTLKGDDFLSEMVDKYATNEDKLDFFGSSFPCASKMILKILRQGLGARVLDIVPMATTTKSWPLASKPCLQQESLTICLSMDTEHAFTAVDRGPQANQTELAEEFRQFWGPKSELRRFKDGAITESCVWCSMKDPLSKKRLICEQICRHLLERHFGVAAADENLLYSSNQFEVALSRCDQTDNLTNEEMALACIKSFDSLSRFLRDLDDLPLDIVSVLGTDPIFRYCDVDYQMGNARFDHEKGVFLANKLCHGIIQLAPSGKWPDDLLAIRRLKGAFHLHLAKRLREQNVKSHARGQMEYVDILYDGFVFRMQIIHPKEIVLMKQHQDKTRVVMKETEASLKMEVAAYILPKLTSSLHALHLQQPAFGAAVRLAKRWLNAQLIDSHLWPEECTELIMASINLKSNYQRGFVQPQAGFLKFLHFLAQSDFGTDLIVVNFNDELSTEDLEALDTKFVNSRSTFPPLSIVTSCDFGKHSLWTKRAPIAPVLARVIGLAQIALDFVNASCVSEAVVQEIFTPTLSGYDAVIVLDRSYRVPSNLVDIEDFCQRKALFAEKRPPIADFRPFQLYLEKLRAGYDHVALFFFDAYGGDRIAVLWRPNAKALNNFNLTNMNGSLLTKDKNFRINTAEILKDFKLIGGELVAEVVCQ